MNSPIRAKALPFAIAALLAVGTAPAIAQNVTSSAVAGQVVDASGQPVANATVTIVHQPSGTTKVVTTDASGRYTAQGLRVGGPFDITASKSGLTQGEQDNVYLQLGQTSAVNLKMAAVEAQNLGAVTVTASALMNTFTPDNKGLSTNVSQRELAATPQGNRSIDDVARLDPRITVTDIGSGAISANGQNTRYNNISVDGVSQGDPFGLNANGMPYQGSPISPDTIAEYNISTANFDVVSDSVGAEINAVTKSGTNDFHGSAYYAYRNASHMVGDAGYLEHDDPNYAYHGYGVDTTKGLTVGGPIIKDKLFFFASAEKQKTTSIGSSSNVAYDPSLGDSPSSASAVSPGDIERIRDIAINQYGLVPGTVAGGNTNLTDDRYLAKLDWNITNNHRASFTYQRTKESYPKVNGNGNTTVGLSSYWYTTKSLTENTVVHLFDDWTENFSTEAKVGLQQFTQDAGGPVDQPSIQVHADGFRSPAVNLGEDQYRHYNNIQTKRWTAFLAGTYYAGDHTIKGGLAFEQDKIYNLFGRTEFGNYVFNSIEDFAAGNYDSYELYQPAGDLSVNDIAARWTYRQYSPFLQDTWQVNDNLSLQYGVRVDIPYSDHKPPYNAAATEAFGYPNNFAVGSSNRVVEPRLSFNYNFDSELMTQLRGGVGLFQTNPPTVWMTNPYQNNGLTIVDYKYGYRANFGCDARPAFSPDPYNQNVDTSADCAIAGPVDTISKDFRLPTVWKATLAFDRELPWWGMVASAEYQHIQVRDGILYQATNLGTPSGVLPDGREQYWTVPGAGPYDFGNHANNGANPAFSTASTLLTNTHKGKSDSLTLALKKPFSDSFFGSASFTLSHATEVNPGGSSQAFSNYQYTPRVNVNTDDVGTSAYNIPRSLKLSLTWQHHFFGDYNTQVSALYVGHDGLPYSWVYSGDANGDGISYYDLAYIPKTNDSLVGGYVDYYGNPVSDAVVQQFQDYISSNKYLNSHRGQIAGRNGDHLPWTNQLDMSFVQEVPGFFKGNKGELRLDVYNFLNLLNKDWGNVPYVQYQTRNLAGYAGVEDGKYVYQIGDKNGNFVVPTQVGVYEAGQNPTRVVSRWSAMVTLRYTF
ncbi:MAG TPA: carboxypeptidase regulatory-like domain-containing protein [Frateuria sp.]|uniref:TonB-dependent receptor n=1 Tax=Frateuria sp. TaxID=2211372 RepID=UPI002D7E231D|nr:carboxypeptidase regulatory-like domain-containing protein [Frateuria sp.]HET6806479.1 carboxypeptidase regulatory-like domain-containing protein [Frateuria sp.]